MRGICQDLKHIPGICRAYSLKHMPPICPIYAQFHRMAEAGALSPPRHIPGICPFTKPGADGPFPAIGIFQAYFALEKCLKNARHMPKWPPTPPDPPPPGVHAIWAYFGHIWSSKVMVFMPGICQAYARSVTNPLGGGAGHQAYARNMPMTGAGGGGTGLGFTNSIKNAHKMPGICLCLTEICLCLKNA